MTNNAYIVSAVRTPGGKKNGSLSLWHPADLGAKVLDELVVQTGIDPSQLVGADTSTGSGGYKTNRGEAHLKSDDYEHHRSVYDEPQVEEKKDDGTTSAPSSKGSMPKGWKPE